jgi:hypothetical protein
MTSDANIPAASKIRFKDEAPIDTSLFGFIKALFYRTPETGPNKREQILKQIKDRNRMAKAAGRKAHIQLGCMQANVQAERRRSERAQFGHIITPLHTPA